MVRSWLIAVAAISVVTVGCKSDPTTPEHWEKRITDAKAKKDKVRAVEDLRGSKYMTPAMLPMLRTRLAAEKAPDVKLAIARLLGEQKDVGSIEALTNAVDIGNTDSDTAKMNKEIADALGTIGDAKAIPMLLKLLDSKDNFTIIAAIDSLGALKATDAVEKLNDIASNEKYEKFINKKAIIALGNIGDARSVPVLVRMMYKERPGTSFYAESSFSLYQIGHASADPLLDVLNGKNKELVTWAEQNNLLPWVLPVKAAQVLGDLHENRAEKGLIDLLNFKHDMLDKQLIVRMRAADALGRMRAKEALKTLGPAMMELEPTTRQNYGWAISRIGSRDAMAQVIASASKGGWDARGESMKSIAMTGDEREDKTLAGFEASEQKTYEAECKTEDFGGSRDCEDVPGSSKKHIETIGKLRKTLEAAKECKNDGACWAKKLDDATPTVRERAAYEVGRSKNAALIGELTKRLREKDLDARLAIIQGTYWLVHDSKEAAAAAKAALPDLQKQLEEERGKTEYVKTNEDLKRLFVKIQRS